MFLIIGPLLHEAALAGVQIIPYSCRLDPQTQSVELLDRLPFIDTYADMSTAPSPLLARKNKLSHEEINKKERNKSSKKRIKKEVEITSITDMTTEIKSELSINSSNCNNQTKKS